MSETATPDEQVEEQIAQEMGDDEPDGELDADTQPDDGEIEQQAAPPPTQAEIERRMKQLDKEAERHTKRVAEIMGDDFALLVPNPLDWTPGFIFDPAAQGVDVQALAALDALIGRGQSQQYRPAPDAETCETCDGWGVGLTGSKAEGQQTKPCRDCSGQGWRTKVETPAPVLAFTGAPTASTGLPAPNQPIQAADRWGRPFGHPHYGLEPAQVGA